MEKVPSPLYQRIILKMSGEALQNDPLFAIDPSKLSRICVEVAGLVKLGVQVALVIGGGNIIRGADLYTVGFDRVTADQMGMLATIMNGLALRDAFERESLSVQVFSALAVPGLVDLYDRTKAQAALRQDQVIICVGGTGNPLVTTDSAAALRGIEINADIVVKATKVDGVFTADPIKHPDAKRYTTLTYEQVLEQRLGVMDLNAILLCRDHNLPVRVFNMNKQHALQQIVLGGDVGTLITGEGKTYA